MSDFADNPGPTKTDKGKKPVLVTGANGFVGKAVLARLEAANIPTRPIERKDIGGTIDGQTDWRKVLEGCGAVIHLAARVHIMQPDGPDALAAFREVNTDGTLALAQQAQAAGVSRFLFMSSLKTIGESGLNISPNAPLAPQGAYAQSKADAEQALLRPGGEMAITILRPPLVYGPGVQANFERMMRWVAARRPLPLASIQNARSLIAVENLADAVCHCLHAPPGTYHPKDATDFSTPELLRALAKALGVTPRLLPFPVIGLKTLGAISGNGPAVERLTSSLTSNGSMAGWIAPISSETAMKQTADAFLGR